MEKPRIKTQEDLLEILQDKLHKEATMESHLEYDLGMDSLDRVEFVMELEKNGFEIPDEKAENLCTVKDVWDCISSQINH